MTWKADVELELAYRARVEDSEKYGYAFQTPERGTIGISAGGRPLYCGPESTLSLAKRHYAASDHPAPARCSYTEAMMKLRFDGAHHAPRRLP